MRELYDPERHEALAGAQWSAARARDAIAAICRDAEAAFDPRSLWPQHPADDEPGMPEDGIVRGLYIGAAGMLHGLSRLAEAGLHTPTLDGAAIVEGLHEASLASPDEEGAGASLLAGSSGILVVAHRLAPSAATADALADAIAANVEHPSNELLLGAPGTMLVARAMHARTGEERFAELWRASARTLLARQDSDGLWTQDLYGEQLRHVGAGHGFAGNVLALSGAPEWLDDAAAVAARAVATTRSLAIVDGDVASWPVSPGGSRSGAPPRVQWCHGAPGMITSLAAVAPGDEQHGALLSAGGELVWRVGPIARNAGLCHGTAGNGYAFLALLARTGDERWLDRARAFAMHALEQVARFRAADGRGRYTLYTGDIGVALFAAACLDGDAAFPGLDDLDRTVTARVGAPGDRSLAERGMRIDVRPVDPEHEDARRCFAAYFAELDRRSEAGYDPAAGVSAEPDELRPPAGVLLIAYLGAEPVGCGALKHHPPDPTDIKRMWVAGSVRGLGLGRRLLSALEARAAADGAKAVRLETSRHLTEAIAMYRKAGFAEVPPFNDEPFADHWFEKPL
jgi:GNAT superfamily N-acetyltransferase